MEIIHSLEVNDVGWEIGRRALGTSGHAGLRPVSLADLIRDKKLLWVYCNDCGHERDIDPRTLPLKPDLGVPFVERHLICSKCGSKKISTKPELCPGGVLAERQRRRDIVAGS